MKYSHLQNKKQQDDQYCYKTTKESHVIEPTISTTRIAAASKTGWSKNYDQHAEKKYFILDDHNIGRQSLE